MNLEVFEAAETVEEAVDAAKRARMIRFLLYVDLRGGGSRRSLLAHHEAGVRHNYSNQISQAMSARGGFPEHMARVTEEAIGLPFGWLDQPYPASELRASIARAKRLMRRIKTRPLTAEAAIGPRRMERIRGGVEGTRGVTKELYQEALKAMRLVI